MKTKIFEIRDHATRICAVAIHGEGPINEHEHQIVRSEGWGPQTILLARLADGEGHTDAYDWKCERPMRVVHIWLEEHFWEAESGQVIDARVILGETKEPAPSDFL